MDLIGKVCQRTEFMLDQHGQHTVFNQVQRGELRPQVAHHLIRHPHILAHETLEGGVDLAAPDHLHHRYLQALLEYFTRVGRAHFAADIRRMCHRTRKTHQLAFEENWLGTGNVGQVPGAKPDVVGDQHIARLQCFSGKLREKMANGARHRADERRYAVGCLRQRAPACIGEYAGEVVGFAHDGGE